MVVGVWVVEFFVTDLVVVYEVFRSCREELLNENEDGEEKTQRYSTGF